MHVSKSDAAIQKSQKSKIENFQTAAIFDFTIKIFNFSTEYTRWAYSYEFEIDQKFSKSEWNSQTLAELSDVFGTLGHSMELVELSDTFSRIWQTRNWIIKTLIIYYIFILLFKNTIHSFRTLFKGRELETTEFDINYGRPAKLLKSLNTLLI